MRGLTGFWAVLLQPWKFSSKQKLLARWCLPVSPRSLFCGACPRIFLVALAKTFQGAPFGFLETILALWKPCWLRIVGLLETIFWPLKAILAFGNHFGLWKPNFCLLKPFFAFWKAYSPFGSNFWLLEAKLTFCKPFSPFRYHFCFLEIILVWEPFSSFGNHLGLLGFVCLLEAI